MRDRLKRRSKSGAGGITRCAALTLAVCVLFLALTPVTALASDPLTNHIEGWPHMEDINEMTAVVMNADNGGILYSLDRDVQRNPASITKILTCLLVLENTSMTDEVTMGQEALDVAIAGNSNINPILGEVFTVEQCLYMLMLKSANDVAVQLAVQVSGSVSAFADLMNARAAAIGCTGTHFTNPNGLPDPNHVTTANDMAVIMRECLKNPTFRKIIATTAYTVPATNKTAEARYYENHNRLIDANSEYYYPSCIGGKTGYTDAAMRTLIAAAEKDGKTLIAVTMGGPDRSDFTDMVKLFEYGFNNFSTTQTSDNNRMTGSYTLPNGLSPNLTTAPGIVDSGGRQIINYIYADLIKVGEMKPQEEAATTAVSDSAAMPSQGSESSAPAEAPEASQTPAAASPSGSTVSEEIPVITIGHRHINRKVFTAVCAALTAFIVILCVAVSSHLEKKRREEARRRRAARRRREGR